MGPARGLSIPDTIDFTSVGWRATVETPEPFSSFSHSATLYLLE